MALKVLMSLSKLLWVINPFLTLILSSSLCLLPLWLEVRLKDALTTSEVMLAARRHLVLELELELDEELELALELEVELELLLEILQDIVEVPDEELPELPFEPLLSEPSFANAGVAAAMLPTSKKANSLCFNDLIKILVGKNNAFRLELASLMKFQILLTPVYD